MTTHTTIETGGGNGSHRTAHVPIPTMRGMRVSSDGTQIFTLKRGTFINRAMILPDDHTPAVAGSVTIGISGGAAAAFLAAAPLNAALLGAVVAPTQITVDTIVAITTTGWTSGSSLVALEVVEPASRN